MIEVRRLGGMTAVGARSRATGRARFKASFLIDRGA